MQINEIIQQMHCYACGHEDAYVLRAIEKTITESGNTVIVPITVGECIYCGEQIMDMETTNHLEAVREQLKQGQLTHFVPVGITYRMAS